MPTYRHLDDDTQRIDEKCLKNRDLASFIEDLTDVEYAQWKDVYQDFETIVEALDNDLTCDRSSKSPDPIPGSELPALLLDING